MLLLSAGKRVQDNPGDGFADVPVQQLMKQYYSKSCAKLSCSQHTIFKLCAVTLYEAQ